MEKQRQFNIHIITQADSLCLKLYRHINANYSKCHAKWSTSPTWTCCI